jgi:hypothetical protein
MVTKWDLMGFLWDLLGEIPSGKLAELLKMTIYSGFTH